MATLQIISLLIILNYLLNQINLKKGRKVYESSICIKQRRITTYANS